MVDPSSTFIDHAINLRISPQNQEPAYSEPPVTIEGLEYSHSDVEAVYNDVASIDGLESVISLTDYLIFMGVMDSEGQLLDEHGQVIQGNSGPITAIIAEDGHLTLMDGELPVNLLQQTYTVNGVAVDLAPFKAAIDQYDLLDTDNDTELDVNEFKYGLTDTLNPKATFKIDGKEFTGAELQAVYDHYSDGDGLNRDEFLRFMGVLDENGEQIGSDEDFENANKLFDNFESDFDDDDTVDVFEFVRGLQAFTSEDTESGYIPSQLSYSNFAKTISIALFNSINDLQTREAKIKQEESSDIKNPDADDRY